MAATRLVGSHTPTSGGLARAALPYVDAAGSEVVQVYVSNSRGWALPAGDPEQDAAVPGRLRASAGCRCSSTPRCW